jgi:tetratricopeptide (TPR) repeat protein
MANTVRAQQLFIEGIAYMEQNDFMASELAFSEALELAPGRISVINNLAAAQIKLHKYDEAMKLSVRSIELDSDNPQGFLNFGLCLAAAGDINHAIEIFTQATILDPHLLPACIYRSYALRDVGRLDEALACGEKILSETYYSQFGKEINLDAPITFTEKLFCRMIHTHRFGNPAFTKCADKYHVRSYIKAKVGPSYLPDLLWSGVSPTDIPFSDLPELSIIKSNAGSGKNLILRRPVDHQDTIKLASDWMKRNYYWVSREYQYYEISERLLIEAFLIDGSPEGLLDYRFFCFGGRPEIIQIDNNSHSINTFYDVNWNKLDLSYRNTYKDFDLKKPANLDEMLDVASTLSSDFDFVRVDLYNCFGRIVFGELTFTPVAGVLKFKPETWDAYLGSKWNYVAN